MGQDISIRELAQMVSDVVGFDGEVLWDTSKPDGTPRKLLNVGKLQALGWTPSIDLRTGIASTYFWYLENVA